MGTTTTTTTIVEVVGFRADRQRGCWVQDGTRFEVAEIVEVLGAYDVKVRLHTPAAPYEHGEVLVLDRRADGTIGCAIEAAAK